MNNPTYLFGDSDSAAERLRLLAYIFAPEIRSFLSQVPPQPRLAIDLGCGPGFTTRLIAETLKARETVGLDTSERFLTMARSAPADGVTFARHDIYPGTLPHRGCGRDVLPLSAAAYRPRERRLAYLGIAIAPGRPPLGG